MALDLDRDYTINGHTFKAGKGVDTSVHEPDPDTGKTKKVDYSTAIKDLQKSAEESDAYVNTHHGASVQPDDPSAASAGTPTRPLAAPNMVADETVETRTTQDNVHELKDPVNQGADESNKSTKKGK